jgi:hypothetical protein
LCSVEIGESKSKMEKRLKARFPKPNFARTRGRRPPLGAR